MNTSNAANSADSGRIGLFQTTQWSQVARAAGRGDTDDALHRREALATILARYVPALRAYLLSRRHRADQVDDLLQSFIADRVIERNLLSRAESGRGQFRSFLLASLNHFIANARRSGSSAKRLPSGQRTLLSLDSDAGLEHLDETLAAPGAAPAGDSFDVAWARQAMAEALRRMHDDCLADRRADVWDVFEARLLAPALEDVEPVSYEILAERHGYTACKHAANVLVTAKRRFEQTLRGVLSEHVTDERELEGELASLGAALAMGPQLDRDEPGIRVSAES